MKFRVHNVGSLNWIIAPHSAVVHYILLTQNRHSLCSVLLRDSANASPYAKSKKNAKDSVYVQKNSTKCTVFRKTITIIPESKQKQMEGYSLCRRKMRTVEHFPRGQPLRLHPSKVHFFLTINNKKHQ